MGLTQVSTGGIEDGSIVNADLHSAANIAKSKLASLDIVNADINASAAIAGSKISPSFTSDITITDVNPALLLVDSNNNSDYELGNQDGTFRLRDSTNTTNRMTLSSTGQFDFEGNVDCNAGLDVTGDITGNGDLTITSTGPTINLVDSNDNPDYRILVNSGLFKVRDTTNNSDRFIINTDGHVDVLGNLDVGAGIDVTGNISVSGTVDGRDLATYGTKLDGIEASATADQTASEILTLLLTVDGAGSGLAADTLDGVSSSQFLRSDTADTASGDITFGGGAGAATIGANSDISFTAGNWTGNHTKIQHHNSNLYIIGGTSGIVFRENTADRWLIDGSGHFDPASDSTYDIGSNSVRVRNGYFDTLYGDGSNLTGINSTTNLSTSTSTTAVTIASSSGNNATISEASGSAAGVMSVAHHDKLDGIAAGANNITNNNQLTNGAGYVTSSGNTIIGTDSDINTSGATVIDQLNMTDGVIQSHSTRTLTLANLGYTGATNANNITNNSQISNGRGYLTNVHSARSAATNGYVRYRDGTQFVWGNVNLNHNYWTTKSFATAFPSVCRAVIVTPNDSSVAGTAQRNMQVKSVNRSNFQGYSGQNTNPANHFFIAVGY